MNGVITIPSRFDAAADVIVPATSAPRGHQCCRDDGKKKQQDERIKARSRKSGDHASPARAASSWHGIA
jgi:hypothetical protein